jgi:hypothetical protein
MSCCAGCDDNNVEREQFQVTYNWNNFETNIKELIGKDVKFVNGLVMTEDNAYPKGSIRTEMTSVGENHRVSIYRNKLPFDELMVTIQFNEKSGDVKTNIYCLTAPFVKVELTLTRVKEKQALFTQLATGIYRVTSIGGFYELFEKYLVMGQDLAHAEGQIPSIHDKDQWPVMAIFNNHSPLLSTRNATVINIPNWKNDAVWQ